MVGEIGEELIVKLEKNSFSKGETINGRVHVRMTKPIIAHELLIRFFAFKVVVDNEGNPIKPLTEEEGPKLQKNSKKLDGEKLYANADYFFSLEIPIDLDLKPIPDNFFAKITEKIRNYMGRKTVLEWYVEASLKISEEDRVDERESIEIN